MKRNTPKLLALHSARSGRESAPQMVIFEHCDFIITTLYTPGHQCIIMSSSRDPDKYTVRTSYTTLYTFDLLAGELTKLTQAKLVV